MDDKLEFRKLGKEAKKWELMGDLQKINLIMKRIAKLENSINNLVREIKRKEVIKKE